MTASRRFRPELLAPLLHDLAAEDKFGEIPVRGTSMCPMLLHGDRVWLIPAKTEEIQVGDIVVRMGESGPILHRVVGWWRVRDGWRILTKGDNVPRFDPPLRADCLIARVAARVRHGQVRRLEGMGVRLRGRGRAAVSLTTGIVWEAWDRGRRATRRWLGLPGG
jgi:signal peptidase I